MNLHMICHVYATESRPYHKIWWHQMASLLRYWPRLCQVTYWHVFNEKDDLTRRVGELIAWRLIGKRQVRLAPVPLPAELFFERAISRNQISKALPKEADAVWYLDCDYLFGPQCLDSLSDLHKRGSLPLMSTPREYMIHKEHAIGDRLISETKPSNERGSKFPEIKADDFMVENPRKAIGGLFIVKADLARQGYLDGTKWVQPTTYTNFESFMSDVRYRKNHEAEGRRFEWIDVPRLYRFRHSPMSREADAAVSPHAPTATRSQSAI